MKLKESYLSDSVKYQILLYLNEEGYHTYADRLAAFRFVVGDIVDGAPVETAWMNSATGTMAIGTGFIEYEKASELKLSEHCLKQLSLLCRHEMLHYLLAHTHRMSTHIKAIGLADKIMNAVEIGQIQEMENIAADWELSERGYDDEDKHVVKAMIMGGRIIGGLVLESDKPEWLGLTLEELFDKLYEEHSKLMKQQQQKNKENENKPLTVRIKKGSHSQEYTDIYNKIIAKYDDPKYSDADLQVLLDKVSRGPQYCNDIEL